LFVPDNGDIQYFDGFDQYRQVGEKLLFFIHQGGQLALDIHQYQYSVFLYQHIVPPGPIITCRSRIIKLNI
jgi:hypothetical protein